MPGTRIKDQRAIKTTRYSVRIIPEGAQRKVGQHEQPLSELEGWRELKHNEIAKRGQIEGRQPQDDAGVELN